MIRITLSAAFLLVSTGLVQAQDAPADATLADATQADATQAPAALGKEDSCNYQGQVMAAVQQARLDRVSEEDVQETLLAANPDWPAQFSNAIPQLAAHVYTIKRRDLRKNDLGEIFEAQCLASWDQIQAITKSQNAETAASE